MKRAPVMRMNGRNGARKQAPTVTVIGGAGHVGLPFCLLLAARGYTVFGVDKNEEANAAIMRGSLPFQEELGEEYLREALARGALHMTADRTVIAGSDVVIITIGTPVDENLNPDLSALLASLEEDAPLFQPGQLIILRSTVAPGTTELFKKVLETKTGLRVGRDLYLVYGPERVMQGKVITEIESLPQIIGAFDDESFHRSQAFFTTFITERCFRLTPVEAELGKLITNMARYIEFAVANEFYLIAESFGANIHNIIQACTYHYPRLRLPVPGPNVGGPCLYKDGWFLLERIPFPDLIATAFKINESMPAHVVSRLETFPGLRKVAILGLTFKADNDDTRNSLSFKLKKLLSRKAYEIVPVDPYVPSYRAFSGLSGCDAVVLMTPHREFRDLERIMSLVGNPDCVYVDLWGAWDVMRSSARNGIFRGHEARSVLEKTSAPLPHVDADAVAARRLRPTATAAAQARR